MKTDYTFKQAAAYLSFYYKTTSLKRSTIVFNVWFKKLKMFQPKIENAILKKDAKTRRKEKKISEELLYATRKSKKPFNLIHSVLRHTIF